jgi:hypothetical protein
VAGEAVLWRRVLQRGVLLHTVWNAMGVQLTVRSGACSTVSTAAPVFGMQWEVQPQCSELTAAQVLECNGKQHHAGHRLSRNGKWHQVLMMLHTKWDPHQGGIPLCTVTKHRSA